MDAFQDELETLLAKPEEYLRPNSDLHKLWQQQSKLVYDFMKNEEGTHKLPKCMGALKKLCIDGFDDEQIWQIVEVQNKSLLAAPDNLNELDDVNLCYMVARLSSQVRYDENEEASDGGGDEEGDEGSINDNASDEDMDEDLGEEDIQDESDEDFSDDEEDLPAKRKPNNDTKLDTHFDTDSENEVDNFDEFIAKEGEETDDDEDDLTPDPDIRHEDDSEPKYEEKFVKKGVKGKKKKDEPQKFEQSNVDSRFFSLRESEWIADNDMIGQNYNEDDDDDVDYMAEMSDDEDEEGVMYNDFFDGAAEGEKPSKKLSEMLNGSEHYDEDNSKRLENGQKYEDKRTDNREEQRRDLFGREDTSESQHMEVKSTFEKERERELQVVERLEDDIIAPKPWHLKGEVSTKDRPENSALEEPLEYNISSRQKPVITEDITALVEKVIMGRIRSKAWDDVERRVKPVADPFEYKKKLLLDQEKSKMSLAEIYEKEYMKQMQEDKEENKTELPEHKKIRKQMDTLFANLDSLSNFHYLPKWTEPELEIKSNLPAINIEDATPVTMSDAATLAPQEILQPVKGQLKGKEERTKTDKKRDRRMKKQHQKLKAKMTEKKLKEKLKNKGPDGKLDVKSTVKVVEKAMKAGQVKMLNEKNSKAVKSSESFFKQLQENSSDKNKQKFKKKKGDHGLTATRILL